LTYTLQQCIEKWKREESRASGQRSSGVPCPNKCPSIELYSTVRTSEKEGGILKRKKQRQHHPYTKLYFHNDLQSDGLEPSSSVSDRHEITAFGEEAFGITRDRKRARIDDSPLGDDTYEDIDDGDDDESTEPSTEQMSEVQRLRRELREAQNTARQGAGARHQAEALRVRCEELEEQLRMANHTIESLGENIDELGIQMHERDVEAGLSAANERIAELEKEVASLETVTLEHEEAMARILAERNEAESTTHEEKLKLREALNKLEQKLLQAGTTGESTIAELKRELSDKDTVILKSVFRRSGMVLHSTDCLFAVLCCLPGYKLLKTASSTKRIKESRESRTRGELELKRTGFAPRSRAG
jgi:hypothetical protein